MDLLEEFINKLINNNKSELTKVIVDAVLRDIVYLVYNKMVSKVENSEEVTEQQLYEDIKRFLEKNAS